MRTVSQKPKAAQLTGSSKSTIPGQAYSRQSREKDAILTLQKTIGNQAVQRLLQARPHGLDSGSGDVNALALSPGAVQAQPDTRPGRQPQAQALNQAIPPRSAQQGLVKPGRSQAAQPPAHHLRQIIQRAMKFEIQTNNILWRTGGKKREKLPRKFGPKAKQFLHHGSKGKQAKGGKEGSAIELQSEAGGFVEFETPTWEREWCDVKKRIQEAVDMTKAINRSKVVRTVGSVKTVEFPFDVSHLIRTSKFPRGLSAGESWKSRSSTKIGMPGYRHQKHSNCTILDRI